MTCIVGVADSEGICMGADSCGSDGHRNTVYERSKMFSLGPKEQPILFGACGSFRLIDAVRFAEIPVRNERTQDLDRWIRTKLVESIRKCTKEAGILESKNEVVSIPGPMLVASEGRLWTINRDLSVLDAPDYGACIGSGQDAARGALYAMEVWCIETAETRVELALEAAAKLISTVAGPFEIRRA